MNGTGVDTFSSGTATGNSAFQHILLDGLISTPQVLTVILPASWRQNVGSGDGLMSLPKVVVSGVIITLAVTVVAVPLRTALFGGVTGSGADLFVAWMHSMGQNLVESVAITVIGANLVDKILTAVIVWLLLRQLPIRTTRHFPAMAAVR